MKNESVTKFVQKDEEDSESLGSEDSYSDRSLTSEQDAYEEDSFIIIEKEHQEVSFQNIKREYLRKKKNINKECCRGTLEKTEDYFIMKLREKELEIRKLMKNKKPRRSS